MFRRNYFFIFLCCMSPLKGMEINPVADGVVVNLDEEIRISTDLKEVELLPAINDVLPTKSRHIPQEQREENIRNALGALQVNKPIRYRALTTRKNVLIDSREFQDDGLTDKRGGLIEKLNIEKKDIMAVTDFIAAKVLEKEADDLSHEVTNQKAQKACSVVMTIVTSLLLLAAEVLYATLGQDSGSDQVCPCWNQTG